MPSKTQQPSVVIVGAGPAGLTTAWELSEKNAAVTVIEKYHMVGGIARTETYKGYRFDIGGHRYFTKIDEVNYLWHLWMGPDFKTRPRKSRIYYNGKFFDYPLKAFNALFGLGILESTRILTSYAHASLFPTHDEETFEEWVSNRFGKRLFQIFFKTYTEKVWGIPTSEIRAEWAAQRIKGLSLMSAARNAMVNSIGISRNESRKDAIKTLVEEFEYPSLGPGQMWETVASKLEARGGVVHLDTSVVRLKCEGQRVTHVICEQDGQRVEHPADHVVSTMPLPELVMSLDTDTPKHVIEAAKSLTYRAILVVVLIVKQRELFPDNWIYIHSPEVKVGRIQNFKNWSPDMVPDEAMTSLGLEYFCDEDDIVWNTQNADLIALATQEIDRIGLVKAGDVVDGTVVRQPKAYPVYNSIYADKLNIIKDYLSTFDNLQTIGRNGLHKYNNMDHSMLTGILAAKNIMGEVHDVWEVNTERSYHEEVRVSRDTQ